MVQSDQDLTVLVQPGQHFPVHVVQSDLAFMYLLSNQICLDLNRHVAVAVLNLFVLKAHIIQTKRTVNQLFYFAIKINNNNV